MDVVAGDDWIGFAVHWIVWDRVGRDGRVCRIGRCGRGELARGGAGIAEALITTAAGLFAAIPAVVAYNLYLGKIRAVAARMDNFAAEFVAKIETIYSA